MSQVSPVLRRVRGGFSHWCPACEEMHLIPDGGWAFNGNVDKPTFHPSLRHGGLRRSRGDDGRLLDGTCHYIITDGTIQFCSDSWHKRSDIVAMPLLPEFVVDFGQETQD